MTDVADATALTVAQFIVLDEAQSDRLLLDLALDGLGSDKSALTEFLCARAPRRV